MLKSSKASSHNGLPTLTGTQIMETLSASTRERLGFGRVLQLIAERAVSPLGQERLLALEPSDDPEEIERRCARLAEVWQLLDLQAPLPISGLFDLRATLIQLRPAGSVIDPEDLKAIAGLSHLTCRMAGFLDQHTEETPRLAEERDFLWPEPSIHEEIDRCIGHGGDVLDAASPDLARLRRDRRRLEQGIRAEIDRMMRDPVVSSLLQDQFHTERSGRHVLPVAAHHRGKLPGIVHDRSASGETIFVEPMGLVELTNDSTEARLAEEAEIRRVLAALSDLVRENLEGLEQSSATLGKLDALCAIADWGQAHRLNLTERNRNWPLELHQCHHPLLWVHHREASVPLNIALAESDSAVVISGPNAGGKTTALKTVGLVHLMTAAGLPVPADSTSNIPVPRAVHADIGDDQDVMTGRSTFTAHMALIADIAERAPAGSLVLLDELGTATDPREGGALAVAILEALRGRGCLTLATSHLVMLKQWAHETDGVQNASVALDSETRRPTYRLTLGLPGPSEALIVAGQVGLRSDILERARELIPEQEQRLGELIREIQERNRSLELLQVDAESAKARLELAEKEHHAKAETAEKERRAFRRDMAKERRRLLAEAKADVERRIANLPSKRDLLDAKTELETEIRETEAEIAEAVQSPRKGGGDFTEGDRVEILDANEKGRILTIDEGRKLARVETERGMMITVRMNRLAPAPEQTTPPKKQGITFMRRDDISMELDLIGMRVEPALEELDKFLDEAASHGLDQVRVIHGFGTGALRTAVRECVSVHPLAKGWRPADSAAGGHAVTVVLMR